MVYKISESEHGEYIGQDNMRYDLMEATNVMTPQGKNVGWTELNNIEEAIQHFNLIYDPPQEILDELKRMR